MRTTCPPTTDPKISTAAELLNELAQATTCATASFAERPEPAALAGEDWSHVLTEETKKSFEERGLSHLLFTQELPTFAIGIENSRPGAFARPATLAEIRGIDDLGQRALAIYANGICGESDDERDLIRSVANASFIGAVMQERLLPPRPAPRPLKKIWSSQYRLWSRRGRFTEGNLFRDFGIDISEQK